VWLHQPNAVPAHKAAKPTPDALERSRDWSNLVKPLGQTTPRSFHSHLPELRLPAPRLLQLALQQLLGGALGSHRPLQLQPQHAAGLLSRRQLGSQRLAARLEARGLATEALVAFTCVCVWGGGESQGVWLWGGEESGSVAEGVWLWECGWGSVAEGNVEGGLVACEQVPRWVGGRLAA
jgi:hypothetical protein